MWPLTWWMLQGLSHFLSLPNHARSGGQDVYGISFLYQPTIGSCIPLIAAVMKTKEKCMEHNITIPWRRCHDISVPRNLGDCAVHSQNQEVACQSQDCALGLRNEIARHQSAISRLHGTGVQSQGRAISVACTIEPFELPLYMKTRNIRNELLQLSHHRQCWICILKSQNKGLLGSSQTQRNFLSFGLGTGAERSSLAWLDHGLSLATRD